MHLLSHPRRGPARDPDLQPHLAPTGLKISQFSLLGFVSAEGPIIDRPACPTCWRPTARRSTRNLRPLLHDGLIERAASGDKRRHELVATPAGRALFKRALPLWAAAEQEVRAAMGARLTADLHGALDRSMEKLATL